MEIVGYKTVRGRERAIYKKVCVYEMKHDVRTLIKRSKTGPAEGYLAPKTVIAIEAIVGTKEAYPVLGAAKINQIAESPVSAPTARKILYREGFPPVTKRKGRTYKTFEMEHTNDMWQIDYVELGTDRITGRKVESLSVIDDHSRMVLSANASVTATTDDVIRILEDAIRTYGAPCRILSDHGTQWCSSNGGTTRFDEWCLENGIEHIMGKVRKPTTQGKVERWHGSIRREAHLPSMAAVEEYQSLMKAYVDFYNNIRPHW